MGIKLHFLHAGRELIEPESLEHVWTVAAFGEAPIVNLEHDEAGKPIYTETLREELNSRNAQFLSASRTLMRCLQRSILTTYVQNPETGAYMRIPREYWFRYYDLPESDLRALNEPATGWCEAMTGQPVLVEREHLDLWIRAGGSAAEQRDVGPSQTAALPNKPSELKCRELAAQFDGEGIPKRDVKAPMIEARWNSKDGPVPTREDIWVFMVGKAKGAPKKK